MLIDRWVCYPSVYQRRRGTRITAAVESVSDGLESQRERERERASSFGTTRGAGHILCDRQSDGGLERP